HRFDLGVQVRIFANPGELLGGIVKALLAVAFDDDVREDAVQERAQLRREAIHDAVDDDERRHAEHDADDASERQVARLEVTPAEYVLVHVGSRPCVLAACGLALATCRGSAKPQAATDHSSCLNSGNKITSRIVCVLVSSITSRSMPMPSPPAGGMPWRWARMKSWSIFAIESSSGSPASCCEKVCSCMIGSFSSVYAFANSMPCT